VPENQTRPLNLSRNKSEPKVEKLKIEQRKDVQQDEKRMDERSTSTTDRASDGSEQPERPSEKRSRKGEPVMTDAFDQARKVTEITFEEWRKLLSNGSWTKEGEQRFFGRCVPWISVIRGACNVNITAWNTFTEQYQEIFFRMFQRTPMHSDEQESRLRKYSEFMQKARKVQQDIVMDSLDKIEAVVKDRHLRR
jgi:hypothetical protein